MFDLLAIVTYVFLSIFFKFDLTVEVVKNILYDKRYFLVFKPSMNSGQ